MAMVAVADPAPVPAVRPASLAVLEPAVEITFDDTLARHGAEIYRFALHLTRNRPDADDLYQETALKAYRAWDRLPRDANHRAWLYRIASNTFLSDKRKSSRLRSLDADGAAETIPALSRDDDGRLDAGTLLREVESFIAALPPKQRIALVQRKYLAIGYAEIAATLGCTEDAARRSVHEALRKLRGRFGDRI
ncbi:MAG: RNA polymerase sigma factor [Chloroflexota bacterium]|nr:RNA polymerase sigma factor [Chloroflexia bacterium]MDQ3225373.1 RNA polymerase sigma factor [Chloroflexota bacterium]